MRQYHLESAVARVTGESLRTIQQRGFGLVRMDSERSSRRSSVSGSFSSQPARPEHTTNGIPGDGSDD